MELRNEKYKTSQSKEIVAKIAHYIFFIFNRPAFRRFNELAYDIALRLNGFGIGFRGRNGLTAPEERLLRKLAPKFQEGAIFDVGANNGSYSRFINTLRPDLPIFAFEPHPKTFAALKSLTTNAQIRPVNQALSDACGICDFYDFASDDGSTQASLSREAVNLFDENYISYKVDVSTLDIFAAQNNISRISLLKVDTEGFDYQVLLGAQETIKRLEIDIIQFEIIPANVVKKIFLRNFLEILPDYKIFRLCTNGDLLEINDYSVKRCEIFVIHNIIAIHKNSNYLK